MLSGQSGKVILNWCRSLDGCPRWTGACPCFDVRSGRKHAVKYYFWCAEVYDAEGDLISKPSGTMSAEVDTTPDEAFEALQESWLRISLTATRWS